MSSTTPISLSGIVARTRAQAPDTPLNKLRVGASPLRSGRSITRGDLPDAIANDVREYEAGPRGGNRLGAAAGALSYAEAVNGLAEGGVKLVEMRARDKNRGINLGDLRALNNAMLETHVDVRLPSDPNDRADIHKRFEAMFPDGRLGFMNAASAALGGIRDVEISKADGAQEGMVKVAVTDRTTWARFEFFLDDTNKRILCGDNFAKWAVKGDARAKQMTELLTALGRGSLEDVEGNNALDRVEFKPGDVDAYALLNKGYGSSCKRGRFLLIVQLAGQFRNNRSAFEKVLGGKKAEEDIRGLEKVLDKLITIENKINRTLNRVNNGLDVRAAAFAKLVAILSGNGDARTSLLDFSVSNSKTKPGDLMKIVGLKERLSLEELRKEPELKSAVDHLASQYKENVPLGRLLLELVSRKSGDEEPPNFVLWDAYETRKAPKAPPATQQGRVVVRHPANG